MGARRRMLASGQSAQKRAMRILIVEDETKTGDYLKQGLTEAGFTVDLSRDGVNGLHLALTEAYDLAVLDVMLPGTDGWQILQGIRRAGKEMPVLFLTARDAVDDRVKGLELGADDYLVKPFAFDELLARIRSVIRRRQGLAHAVISVADLSVDTTARTVTRGSQAIPLSAREYALLEYLAGRRGETVTRAEIVEHVYDFGSAPSSNVVDVYIGYLRRKIDQGFDAKLIHTRRGMGYSLGEPE